MTDDTKTKGPASYFPSIEKNYGQPISHWLDLLKTANTQKHMERVAWLKTEHGMGHEHANALVAYYVAAEKGKCATALPFKGAPQSPQVTVDDQLVHLADRHHVGAAERVMGDHR